MPLEIVSVRMTLQCTYLMLSRSKSFNPLILKFRHTTFIFPSLTVSSLTNSGSKIGTKFSRSPEIDSYCQSTGVCAWRRNVSVGVSGSGGFRSTVLVLEWSVHISYKLYFNWFICTKKCTKTVFSLLSFIITMPQYTFRQLICHHQGVFSVSFYIDQFFGYVITVSQYLLPHRIKLCIISGIVC
jgi:hypothetical protein